MSEPLALSPRPSASLGSLALLAVAGLAVFLAAFAHRPSTPVAEDDAVPASEQGLEVSLKSVATVAEGYEVRVRLTETAGGPAVVQASRLQLSGAQGALCPVATASPLVRLAGGGFTEATYVFPYRECYEPIAIAQSVKLGGRLQITRDGRVQDIRLRLSRDAANN